MLETKFRQRNSYINYISGPISNGLKASTDTDLSRANHSLGEKYWVNLYFDVYDGKNLYFKKYMANNKLIIEAIEKEKKKLQDELALKQKKKMKKESKKKKKFEEKSAMAAMATDSEGPVHEKSEKSSSEEEKENTQPQKFTPKTPKYPQNNIKEELKINFNENCSDNPAIEIIWSIVNNNTITTTYKGLCTNMIMEHTFKVENDKMVQICEINGHVGKRFFERRWRGDSWRHDRGQIW